MNTTYFQQSLFSQEIEGSLEQMDRIRVFFNKLDEKYKKNITFRARMNSKDSMHFDEDKFILSLSPHIKFDDGSQHIYRVIKNYDLIMLRPANGFKDDDRKLVIGKKVNQIIKKNEIILRRKLN